MDKALETIITRNEQLAKQRKDLIEFVQEVRRSGDTRLASMALAVLSRIRHY